MKKTNTLYWIFTIPFAAMMLFSSYSDIVLSPDAIKFMSHLGYPNYFTQFIGIAKVLGVIGILIPGFPRIKEWAYAGLAFDLIGATYSLTAVEGLNPGILFMLLIIAFEALSYFYYHKKLQAK